MPDFAEQVAAAAERAAERHERERADCEPIPESVREDKPTKQQSWEAWQARALDADETPDRDEFEAWWNGG